VCIAHGAPIVDQHDNAVLAVEQLIDEFMNAACITANSLPKRHDSPLRGISTRRRRGERAVRDDVVDRVRPNAGFSTGR
jgi:hypothetical protein